METVLGSKGDRLFLMKRDLEIFNFLYRRKVSEFNLLKDKFFKDADFRIAQRRLLKLKKHGLIDYSFYKSDGKAIKYFYNSKKAFEMYLKEDDILYKGVKLKSEHVSHDLALGYIGDKLLNLRASRKFFFENELNTNEYSLEIEGFQDFKRIKTDSVLEYERGDITYHLGVEYESNAKSNTRYTRILKKYYSSENISGVIYVCSNMQILNKISKLEKEIFSNEIPKIYYILKEEVLNHKGSIQLVDMVGKKLTL